jgi:lipase
VHAWGPEDGRRVVCLHGVTGWGGHFGSLATGALGDFRVLAPDLLGHGSSPSAPPWGIHHQIEAVLATVGDDPAIWIGHSFGGRIAAELAAAHPGAVERLVLLDPAIVAGELVADHYLFYAEEARTRTTYATFDELVDRRFAEGFLKRASREAVTAELRSTTLQDDDGRWGYRYVQAMVVAVYGELAADLPPLEAIAAETLLVRGEETYIPFGLVLPELQDALGERLEVVTVPGGHTVLWDALPETAAAVAAFLAR